MEGCATWQPSEFGSENRPNDLGTKTYRMMGSGLPNDLTRCAGSSIRPDRSANRMAND